MKAINVFSEIGKLKTVLLNYPREELNNLTPKYLEDLLFDDIPWLPLAQKEHDAFAQAFKDNGVEVLYLVDLISEVISLDNSIRDEFIEAFIEQADINSDTLTKVVKDYLYSFSDNHLLIEKMIAGIKRTELPNYKNRTLTDYINNNAFVVNPMPNLYFTRDPFCSIGNGVSINKMYFETRRRETLFANFIFKYHPRFKDTPQYYSSTEKFNIEGGDVCVLNKETLIIGVSQRTSPQAIEKLAKNLFYKNETTFKQILVFTIPKMRTFMHLDTVFTQVDYNKFAIHGGIYNSLKVYEVTKSDRPNKLKTKYLNGRLEEILSRYINKEVILIPCGAGDDISADREQWSDGSNFVCIKPGVVIAYERNTITNELLEKYGIKVIKIPSSELSRGRGGPRCMSMPIIREDIED